MKSPIERRHQKDKRLLPLRGEGNQSDFNLIHQSETTHTHQVGAIGEMKRND